MPYERYMIWMGHGNVKVGLLLREDEGLRGKCLGPGLVRNVVEGGRRSKCGFALGKVPHERIDEFDHLVMKLTDGDGVESLVESQEKVKTSISYHGIRKEVKGCLPEERRCKKMYIV